MIILRRHRFPMLARLLANSENVVSVPIDIETPRKNMGQSKQVAEKKIDELKKLVKKDFEDFAKAYMQVDYRRRYEENKEKDEYQFNKRREKEVQKVQPLFVEEADGAPAQPQKKKLGQYDEGSVTLYSKGNTLAPGIEHEQLESDKGQRSYDRNKAIWCRISFSWEESEDPANPNVFWWEGNFDYIEDPAKVDWVVKRKHLFKDYAEIERYMNRRLNVDEIIKDTSQEHTAGIKARMQPIVDQVRQTLKPLLDKPMKFANYPTPIKLELKETESLEGEDQNFNFKLVADPKKPGYDPFTVLYVALTHSGGKFHTPYSPKDFEQYFSSHFDLPGIEEDSLYSPISEPDFSHLGKLVSEVQQAIKKKIPVLDVDEDEIEEEPKQLEAPEEESA